MCQKKVEPLVNEILKLRAPILNVHHWDLAANYYRQYLARMLLQYVDAL